MGMEEIVGGHPEVSGVLFVGQGRRRSSLLIEAKEPGKSPVARDYLLDEIWPSGIPD